MHNQKEHEEKMAEINEAIFEATLTGNERELNKLQRKYADLINQIMG